MSKTVVIVSENGKLINVLGVDKESDARYAKFAKRLLGDNGTETVLDYGWSGKDKLKISASGEQGEKITLDAEEVVVTGDLKIGTDSLSSILDNLSRQTLDSIVGTTGEISVTTEDSPASSGTGYICTVSLDPNMLSRIETVETTVEDLLRFDEAYKIGDGLEKYDAGTNAIRVKLGTGLKFDAAESSDDSSEELRSSAITLDYDDIPTAGSNKPVTSGGIYAAINKGASSRYAISVDASSGNMILLENATATEGE